MTDEHDDDEAPPPASRAARTPAERAGATPLDPERFKANAGMPMVQREREIVGRIPDEEVPVAPVVRRRRSRPAAAPRRAPRSARGFLVAAAVLAVVGLLTLAVAWFTDGEQQVAATTPPELVATTPVLSARRVPELVARPVAARNLRAAVDPVLAAAPPDTCLQVRDGANALLSQKEADAVIPASNLKLVTAAATLALLDPESRFTTRVATDGAPTDGKVVRGNLYLIGGGDPLLSTAPYVSQLPNGEQPSTDMAALADQIAATGIREVTGSVVGDESRYDDVRTAGNWPQRYITQGQVAPLSALVVDDTWSAGAGPGGDPAVHAAGVLTDLLQERGIQVAGAPASGVAPGDAAPLTEIESLTVAEIVDEALRFSDNTTVELLVKEIGLQASGTGSTAAGLEAIRGWLDASGLPADGVVLTDGSGLSEENRATCALLAGLLEADGPEGVIAAGLARPGEPGTLDDRLLAADLRDRVRAKTGTLRPVTALSGWLRTVPERNLGFSFVINRPGGQITEADTALQGDLLTAMLSYPQTPDPAQLVPAAAAPPAG
jgi:D-alanyl-D-alanine carboxypeptidase/D-alanyl-D-alanine-endopeptidase (penicillin-binding protein 4)